MEHTRDEKSSSYETVLPIPLEKCRQLLKTLRDASDAGYTHVSVNPFLWVSAFQLSNDGDVGTFFFLDRERGFRVARPFGHNFYEPRG